MASVLFGNIWYFENRFPLWDRTGYPSSEDFWGDGGCNDFTHGGGDGGGVNSGEIINSRLYQSCSVIWYSPNESITCSGGDVNVVLLIKGNLMFMDNLISLYRE